MTRMAPTPSGFLHLGNMYNFILNWLWARANNGKVLLRIDDADTERKRKEYLDDIFRVLEKTGLDWDLGPTGPDDFERNWTQAQRNDIYASLLATLREQSLLYACTCSRKDRQHGFEETPCNCRDANIPFDAPAVAWRIKTDPGAVVSLNDKRMGNLSMPVNDFIVRRKDGIASYQLSSLADDRIFFVSHIARGEDLLESTACQVFIDQQLEMPWFSKALFWHHPLLKNSDGTKISKSAGQSAVSLLQETEPSMIIRSFGEWMGWDTEKYQTLQDMINHPDFTS